MESYYKPNPRWPGVPHHTQADLVFHLQGMLPKAAADTRRRTAQSYQLLSWSLYALRAVTKQTLRVYLINKQDIDHSLSKLNNTRVFASYSNRSR